MLLSLKIQNYALISLLEVRFNAGLQVITGETGAGKSIILGALRLILGERADIKNAGDPTLKSVVEAEFYITETLQVFFEENDLDYEELTVVRREILPSGKSRAFVNDVPVTLETLRSLSEQLIDIHSQFETASLFSSEFQFKILDNLGGSKSVIMQYRQNFEEYRKKKIALAEFKNALEQGQKDSDYRNFILNELLEADLDMVDLEDIQERLRTQENAGNISENLAEILARFDAEDIGILDSLNDVRSKLSKTAELSHQFTELEQRFEEYFVELKDMLFEMQNRAELIETDPALLQQLNDQYNKVNALFLKHQVSTVLELVDLREKLSGEQSGFAQLEEQILLTQTEIEQTEKSLNELGAKISKQRSKSAAKFKSEMESLLKKLGLEKARIEVDLQPDDHFNALGKDQVELLFQANAGFPLKPIKTAVSGGERSRVMLAVKKIMAENSEFPTLILDEIDTGVSGKVADEMGKVMREMASDMQLIVITHLAQVAAKGDDNYKVVKSEISGKTQSDIIALHSKEKLQEIAQLLSGSKITDAALKQAAELMK